MSLGLGIDTGGIYTDAVIYDFNSEKIIDSAKSVTMKESCVNYCNTILIETNVKCVAIGKPDWNKVTAKN